MKTTTRDSIELHMLTSLARSQRALCRIIEAVADQVEGSEQLAQHLAENIEMLSKYQRTMIGKLTKLSPRTRTRTIGKLTDPWINNDLAFQKVGQFPRK
jgi:hypothetical protein